MTEEQKNMVEKTINSKKIFLMLKGTPEQPRCGFSNRVVQVLNHFEAEYSSFNIFEKRFYGSFFPWKYRPYTH